MAIQNRRGAYEDFDSTKMVAGEWAVVQSGDPNSTRGRSVYMAFQNGEVERMATYEDMAENIDNVTADIRESLTTDVGTAISNATAATTSATNAAASANTAASSASSMATLASNAASAAQTATTNANTATTRANSAASSAESASGTAQLAIERANTAAETAETATTEANTAATNATQAAENASSIARQAEASATRASELIDEAEEILQQGAVASFNGRVGTVVPASGDYTASQITYGSGTVQSALDGNASDIATLVPKLSGIYGLSINSSGRLVVTYEG